MNGGEVVVCRYCGHPFEVLQEKRHERLFCPYCGESL